MWQYNHLQPNELMHYGKKGMKWGRRRGPISAFKNAHSTHKANVKTYTEASKRESTYFNSKKAVDNNAAYQKYTKPREEAAKQMGKSGDKLAAMSFSAIGGTAAVAVGAAYLAKILLS